MASSDNMVLSVLLRAVDQVSGPVRRVQSRLGAFRRQAENIGRRVGFDRLVTSLNRAGKATRELYNGVARVGRRLVTIGAIGVGAITGITMMTASLGDNIAKTADKIGVGVEQLQEMQYAAGRAGIGVSAFDNSLERMVRRVADAAEGSGEAVSALDELGLSAEGLKRKSPDEALGIIADAFGNVENHADRVRLAYALFGREGVAMVNMLREGSHGLEEMYGRARELGHVMSEEAARETEVFTDKLGDMRASLTGVRNTVGMALMPVFAGWIDQMTEFVTKHQPAIQAWAENFAANLPGHLASIREGFGNLMTSLEPVINLAGSAVDNFGMFNTVLGVLAAFIAGPIVMPLISFAAAIMNVGYALTMVAIKSVPILLGALKGVGAALLATPFGWVAAGIAGIAVAALTIRKYWQPLVAFFKGVGRGMRDGLSPVIESLGFIPELLKTAFEFVKPVLKPVIALFKLVGSAIGSAAKWFSQLLTPVEMGAESLNQVGDAGEKFGRVLSSIIGPAIQLAMLPFRVLASVIKGSVSIVKGFSSTLHEVFGLSPLELLKSAWDGLTNYFSNVFGAVKRLLTQDWSAIKDLFNWSPVGLLINNFGAARDYLASVDWQQAAQRGWSAMKTLFRWSPLGLIARGFGRALDWLGELDWSAVGAGAWEVFKGIFKWSPLGLMAQGFNAALDYLSEVDWSAVGAQAWEAFKMIFAWSPLGLLINGFGAATSWLQDLDWSAHGRALIDTLTDGIKAVINKPAEMVRNGLGRVRDLLPFSDAKTGPLSSLTASGSAIPETISEGVERNEGSIVRGMEHMVGSARDVLAGAWDGLRSLIPGQPQAQSAMPELPPLIGQAEYQVTLGAVPTLPALSGHAIYEAKLEGQPELPQLRGKAWYEVALGDLPALPTIEGTAIYQASIHGAQALPQVDGVANYSMPELPPLIGQAEYQVTLGAVPTLPALSGHAIYEAKLEGQPELPQLRGKAWYEVALGVIPALPRIFGAAIYEATLGQLPTLPELTGRAVFNAELAGLGPLLDAMGRNSSGPDDISMDIGTGEQVSPNGGGKSVIIQSLQFSPQFYIEMAPGDSPQAVGDIIDERLQQWKDREIWEQLQGVQEIFD
jgi:hypothetical protein